MQEKGEQHYAGSIYAYVMRNGRVVEGKETANRVKLVSNNRSCAELTTQGTITNGMKRMEAEEKRRKCKM